MIKNNEFTKEELNKLFKIVSHHCARIAKDDGEDNLLRKIHSLIENYCEHKFSLSQIGKSLIKKCSKCGYSQNLLGFI